MYCCDLVLRCIKWRDRLLKVANALDRVAEKIHNVDRKKEISANAGLNVRTEQNPSMLYNFHHPRSQHDTRHQTNS